MRSSGALFCIASGAAFGAMAVFGKLAYDEGATVGTLLGVRFTLAAAMFWVLDPAARDPRAAAAATSAPASRSAPAATRSRPAATSSRSAASRRSLLALLLYTFPAIVAVAAVALGRERFGSRHVIARLPRRRRADAGAGRRRSDGALDPLGVALGLGAAVVYSAYILVSDRDRRGACGRSCWRRSCAPARR